MKYILLITMILFGFQTVAISQRGNDGKEGRIDRLKSELELSDTQVDNLKNAFETIKNDSEITREAQRAAIEKAYSDILTDEQLTKFETLKANRKNGRSKKGEPGKRGKQKKKRLEKDEETRNKLIEMRTELDQSISPEDKQTIIELRETFSKKKDKVKTKKAEFKSLSKEEKKATREQRKLKKDEMKEDYEKARTLASKYDSEINGLFESNKAFFDEKKEEWKAKKEEQKAKHKKKSESRNDTLKKQDKSAEIRKGKRGNKKQHGKRHASKEVRFLLMDPNNADQDTKEIMRDLNTLSLAPNPASTLTNVTYEVKEEGLIRIDIRDESGRVYEEVVNEVLQVGMFSKAVDTSKYQDKVYYISITDGKSIKTEKLIIQN